MSNLITSYHPLELFIIVFLQLVTADGSVIFKECEDKEAWLLLYSSQAASTSVDDKPVFMPVVECSVLSRNEQLRGKKPRCLDR